MAAYTISTHLSSQYNHYAKNQMILFSSTLAQDNKILVRLHSFDEIGIICCNKKISSLPSKKFYLDEDPYHIHHNIDTNDTFYVLECIIVTDSTHIAQIIFKQPIRPSTTLDDVIKNLLTHYQHSNTNIYLVIPIPHYALLNTAPGLLFESF